MAFPHQAFIIWDLKSYQPSPARTNTVAGGDSEPRGSGRAGEHSAVPTPLLCTRDPREKTSHTTALPKQKDQRQAPALGVFSVTVQWTQVPVAIF